MIRPATAADAATLAAADRAAFPDDAWDAVAIAELLGTSGRRAWMELAAESSEGAPGAGGPRGYVLTGLVGDFAELLRIAVGPAHRRHGIARALLATAVDRARADGADRLLLEVSETNEPALAFYAAEGFVRIDVRPRYYRDGSAALVLERPLARAHDPSGRMAP